MKPTQPDNPNDLIPEYFENPAVRPYLKKLQAWQGYVRFLGRPGRSADIEIGQIFIPPMLRRVPVPAAERESTWVVSDTEWMTDAIGRSRVLVVLGESGSGKTALANHLAWEMSRPEATSLVKQIGWHLPLPMMLRELPLAGVRDFEGLREAFLSREMSAPLRSDGGRTYLEERLTEGAALVVLDGADEAGAGGADGALAEAVADGITRYPQSRWIITARTGTFEGSGLAGALAERARGETATRYIAPFDKTQIRLLTQRWYERGAMPGPARERAGALLAKLHATPGAPELATVPHMLILMLRALAKINRPFVGLSSRSECGIAVVDGQFILARALSMHEEGEPLPRTREALYDEAIGRYLDEVDNLASRRAPTEQLPHARPWLREVAFDMQRRRSSADDEDGRSGLMIDRWGMLGMMGRPIHRAEPDRTDAASKLFDRIARRNGLLLPRGEERYTFIHTSLQEYLASEALER